ncbi:MAG: hypothetical protein ACJ74G_20595 [Blastocatellia bacterium]
MMPGYISPYESCTEVCGNLERPGLALDMPLWVDHTREETTIDQAAIEAQLARFDLGGKNLLHVGVGNSKFAGRFAGQVNLIDGVTVSRAEKAVADSQGIGNYAVYLLNKYSREFILTIKNRFDFIIDNNMASFACCKFHFYLMLDNYVWSLKPGGQILTDQRGMDWVIEEPRWKLTYEDLQALAEKFPLRAARLSDTVFSMQVRK